MELQWPLDKLVLDKMMCCLINIGSVDDTWMKLRVKTSQKDNILWVLVLQGQWRGWSKRLRKLRIAKNKSIGQVGQYWSSDKYLLLILLIDLCSEEWARKFSIDQVN